MFQGVSKQMISSKANDVLSFTIFKSSLIKKQLDATHPPKKDKKQKESKTKFSHFLLEIILNNLSLLLR